MNTRKIKLSIQITLYRTDLEVSYIMVELEVLEFH